MAKMRENALPRVQRGGHRPGVVDHCQLRRVHRPPAAVAGEDVSEPTSLGVEGEEHAHVQDLAPVDAKSASCLFVWEKQTVLLNCGENFGIEMEWPRNSRNQVASGIFKTGYYDRVESSDFRAEAHVDPIPSFVIFEGTIFCPYL